MIFNCIMIFLGGFVSIITFFAYDTYVDNVELKREIERLKKLRKEKEDE